MFIALGIIRKQQIPPKNVTSEACRYYRKGEQLKDGGLGNFIFFNKIRTKNIKNPNIFLSRYVDIIRGYVYVSYRTDVTLQRKDRLVHNRIIGINQILLRRKEEISTVRIFDNSRIIQRAKKIVKIWGSGNSKYYFYKFNRIFFNLIKIALTNS